MAHDHVAFEFYLLKHDEVSHEIQHKIQKNMIIVVDKIFNTVMGASYIDITSFFIHR